MKRFLLIFSLLASIAFLGGCDDGADGADGAAGPAGPEGPAGPAGPPGEDLTATLEPESCAVCHSGAGEEHQVVYNAYGDESQLQMEILEVKSVVAGGGTFNVTMTVSIMEAGLPYIDADGLPALDQARFYVQGYDSATRIFPNAMNRGLNDSITSVPGQPGVYKIMEAGVSYAPENSNAFGYGYIAQGHLDTEPGDHIHLYDDVSNAALVFGDVGQYDSYANVEGCEACHGEPYLKHGYRAAVVEGLPTFAACKVCHMDDRAGGHEEWQQMVDAPVAWGNDESADLPEYAYTRRIMNDVHMSHAMEFPYPQGMSNCSTCHEDQMDKVTADDFFVAETCKSCHPVQTRPEDYREAKRAPSLQEIWDEEGVGFHDIDMTCTDCHGSSAISFGEIHTGYDSEIYAANGDRYSELYTAEITSLSMADGKVDIKFTANTDLMTAPQVLVSFYGYDTKQFIVSSHSRDADRNRLGEYTIGGDSPYFTEEADSAQSNWHVTLDTTAYPEDLGIQEMIADGVIRRLEVSIRPTVTIEGINLGSDGEPDPVATNGVSKTLEMASNTVDDDYFKAANAVVDIEGCNACHDALATTFHSADRGGDITLCKHCHYPGNGGSHLEMQSREIASYVHSIHQFQVFDTDEIDFSDPVFAKRYEHHIGFVFPNFTIKNCEACHLEGTYNVPDQAESLPVVLSESYQNSAGPDGEDTWMRNIGTVPSYVVGPASKACGACHRAHVINEDAAGKLASFNQHTKDGGYLVEDDEGVWDAVVAEIMALFE